GVMQKWVNGVKASAQQGPNSIEATGESLDHELADAIYNEEVRIMDVAKVNLLGKSNAAGEEAYVLEVTKPEVEAEKWYVSTKTGRIIQQEKATEGGMNKIKYSDFREVDGVILPYRIDIVGPQEVSVVISSITHNQHPDP